MQLNSTGWVFKLRYTFNSERWLPRSGCIGYEVSTVSDVTGRLLTNLGFKQEGAQPVDSLRILSVCVCVCMSPYPCNFTHVPPVLIHVY